MAVLNHVDDARSTRPRWGLYAALAALALSLAGNAVLFKVASRFYLREQQARLEPAGPPIAYTAGSGPVRVLMIGDSRIAGWPALPSSRYTTINAGVSGETTAQVMLRAEAALGQGKPNVVVIQAGINDLKTIGLDPGREQEIIEKTAGHLAALINQSLNRGARVIYIPILPAAKPPLARRLVWSPRIESARQEVNRRVAVTFKSQPSVAILQAVDSLDPRGSGDYRDTLHLNAKGYEKLQAALTALLGTSPNME